MLVWTCVVILGRERMVCTAGNMHLFPKETVWNSSFILHNMFSLSFYSFSPSTHTGTLFKADSPNGALETDTSVIWVDLVKAWKEIPTRSTYISNDYKWKTSFHLSLALMDLIMNLRQCGVMYSEEVLFLLALYPFIFHPSCPPQPSPPPHPPPPLTPPYCCVQFLLMWTRF